MKVLHLIGGGDDGGAKIHVLSLVKELSKYIDIKIISFRHGMFANDAKAMGINIEIIKTGNIISDTIKVINIIKKEGYEIIHSHGAKGNMMSVISRIFLKVPSVTTVHSDYRLDYMQSFYKKMTYGVINTVALRFIDFYVAVSNNFKNMLIDRNFKKERIMTLYNGVDFNKKSHNYDRTQFSKKYNLNLKENDIVIGILARLHPVKGFDTFIRAAKEVLLKNKNVSFLIGGEGQERKNLESAIKFYGLESNMFLLGYIYDPYEFMYNIDINVLTSISESFPYSILEGTMYKKATISSDVGGISDLITNGQNGYLIKPGDYKTLAKNIIELCDNKKLRDEMGESIYKKAKSEFSLENMCKTQIDIYEKILKEIKNKYKKTNSYDVIISGYYGFNNIGDDAMLTAIVDDLKYYKEDANIMVLSKNPIESMNVYKIDSVYRFNIFKIIKSMKNAKVFINGGGSLIQDNSSTRSLLYYLFLIWLSKKMKMKAMIYANGIGPIIKNFNKKIAKKILNSVDIITLRDMVSSNELKRIGVNLPKILVTADPALSIESVQNKTIDDLLLNENIDINDKLVGFSVRKWNGIEKYQEVMANVADYINKKYNLRPVFLPMHYPEDILIIEGIVSKMKSKGHIIKNIYTAQQVKGIIGRFEVLIGMRLHALIFAASQCIPIVGLIYEPKVDGFMKYVGQVSTLPIESLDTFELKKVFDKVMENKDAIKLSLKQNIDFLQKKSKENAKIAIELMN